MGGARMPCGGGLGVLEGRVNGLSGGLSTRVLAMSVAPDGGAPMATLPPPSGLLLLKLMAAPETPSPA
jgi:hypothetical protein